MNQDDLHHDLYQEYVTFCTVSEAFSDITYEQWLETWVSHLREVSRDLIEIEHPMFPYGDG